jgi:uncharacterized protein (DUF927 family)
MAGSPRYLKNHDVMAVSVQPEKEIRWDHFIKTRKGEGIKQASILRDYLMKKEEDWGWDFVSFSEIERFMKSNTGISRPRLTRLLKEMEQNQIIRKKIVIDPSLKSPNKERTFYQYQSEAEMEELTYEGYRKEYFHQLVQINELNHRLDSALNVINDYLLLQEYIKTYKMGAKWSTVFPALNNPEEYIKSLHPKEQYLIKMFLEKGVGKNYEEILIKCFEAGIESCYKNRHLGKNFPYIERK